MSVISVAQALRDAVAAEQAAAAFYGELATRAAGNRARSFFEAMQGVELQHGREIEEFGRRVLDVELAQHASQEVELVETAPSWSLVDGLSLDEAMQVALESETQAAAYYAAIAERVPEPAATYFRALAIAEGYHANMVRRTLELRASKRPRLAQVVRNSIEAEKAAGRFYARLASSSSHPAAREFLRRMVDVESQHAHEIERLAQSLFHGPLAAQADTEVDLIETPPMWPGDHDLELEGALRVAHEAELHAARYYDQVADLLSGDDAAFMRSLARTERDHASMILDVLSKLRPSSTG